MVAFLDEQIEIVSSIRVVLIRKITAELPSHTILSTVIVLYDRIRKSATFMSQMNILPLLSETEHTELTVFCN